MKEHDAYLIATIVDGVSNSKSKIFEFGKDFPKVGVLEAGILLTQHGIEVPLILTKGNEYQVFAYDRKAKEKDIAEVYKKHDILRLKLSARILKEIE